MSQKLFEADPDYAIHFACGLVPTAFTIWLLEHLPSPLDAVALSGGIAITGVMLLVGFGREIKQHWGKWLTPHQLAEALLWPVGSGVSVLVYWLVWC